jgi:hypothetical protein
MLSKSLSALALALTFPLLLNGCGLDDAQDAQVRLVNATTEYDTMDLYDVNSDGDSSLFISGTASNAVSSYQGLSEGSYTFKILGAGGSSAASSTSGSVTKQDHFVLVSYLSGGALTTLLMGEDESAPASGNAKLRILNGAASEVGSVDVFVTSHECTALTDTDTAFATSVSGLQDSFGEIVTSSAGSSWNLCVTGAGSKSDLRLAITGAAFKNKQISTLILTRTSGGVLVNGMLLDQQGSLVSYTNTLARVRLVADAANSGQVSATVNNVALAVDQISPQIGTYQSISSGALTMSLSIGGTAVTTTPLTVDAGGDYTLLVAGTAAAPTIALLADNNTPSTSTSLPVKMRLVNGLNNLDTPASLTASGSLVASGIAFGSASGYGTLAANSGTADILVNSGGATQFSLADQTLVSGGIYTVFLLGDSTLGNASSGSSMILDRSGS